MTKRIYRYEVPIDDKPHTFELNDIPVSAAVVFDTVPYLEFWTEHDSAAPIFKITYQVYGTGHEIPSDSILALTAPRIHGLVFHLVELSWEDA